MGWTLAGIRGLGFMWDWDWKHGWVCDWCNVFHGIDVGMIRLGNMEVVCT